MKKQLLKTVIAILIMIFTVKAQEKIDREKDNLIGLVKAVKIEKGFISDVNERYKKSNVRHYQTVAYDKKGNRIKETPIGTCGNGSPTENIYNDKGQLIEERIFNYDGSLWGKLVHTYDEKGNLRLSDYYDAKGVLYRKWSYSYSFDSHGNWIRQIAFMQDKEVFIVDFFIPREVTYRTFTYY